MHHGSLSPQLPPRRLTAITSTLLFVLATALAPAQGGRCIEDPCDNAWTTTSTSFSAGWYIGQCTSNGHNCNLEISFSHRIGCDGACELRIHEIKYTSGPLGCNCPWTDIWQAAIIGLVSSHPNLNCRPLAGECVQNLRVWTEGCWNRHPGMPGEPDVLQPCASFTMCCKAEYEVCKSLGGTVTIQRTSVTGTSFSCPQGCDNVCNYFPLTNQ